MNASLFQLVFAIPRDPNNTTSEQTQPLIYLSLHQATALRDELNRVLGALEATRTAAGPEKPFVTPSYLGGDRAACATCGRPYMTIVNDTGICYDCRSTTGAPA